MTIHNFNVNPFQINTSGPKNFIKIMEEKMELLWQHTEQPIYQPKESDEYNQDCECKKNFNKLVD
jgi:hypothetical protein